MPSTTKKLKKKLKKVKKDMNESEIGGIISSSVEEKTETHIGSPKVKAEGKGATRPTPTPTTTIKTADE